MFQPGHHSEIETLAGYLEEQLASIRAAALGLTDEQARATPCRSSLSIGGLVKHATHVIDGRARRRDRDPAAMPNQDDFAEFMGSFALTDDETLEGVLARFDASVAAYLADVRASDPAAETVEPVAPWDGLVVPAPSVDRFALVHHIEELARHAGHADIIREQLDGASAPSLLMAAEGRPGNDFVQPWQPA